MHKPKPDAHFAWNKRVLPEWQAELDRLSVVGENVSRLWLTWLPGTSYAPIQRWAIYEVVPASTIARILRQEELLGITDSITAGVWGTKYGVRGPDPLTVGVPVMDPSVPGGKRWRSTSMVSRAQWLVHQQTGGMPYLCWIIEGDRGGHAWHLGQLEQALLLASGADPNAVSNLMEAWPAPGDQPYAEYDNRVFNALAERDRLQQWRQSKPWDQRSDRDTAQGLTMTEKATRHTAIMERVMKYIDNQVGDFMSDLPRATLAQLPKADFGTDPDLDGSAQQLLEE